MPPPLIDIGINLTHRQFHEDRDAVIARAAAAGPLSFQRLMRYEEPMHTPILGMMPWL